MFTYKAKRYVKKCTVACAVLWFVTILIQHGSKPNPRDVAELQKIDYGAEDVQHMYRYANYFISLHISYYFIFQ